MINFGIIGFGLHAVKRLMPGFALAKNCRVSALSRRDLAKAQASARQYDIPLAFDSAEELCRSPQVDAVFVATPNACHLRDVLIATACGKPVLCEKPMAVNAAECRQMVEAARTGQSPAGNRASVSLRRKHGVVPRTGSRGKDRQSWFSRAPNFPFLLPTDMPRTWINDPAIAGGGPVADVGVHCIDALRLSCKTRFCA